MAEQRSCRCKQLGFHLPAMYHTYTKPDLQEAQQMERVSNCTQND